MSVGSKIAVPLNTTYHATKFGLEGIFELLQFQSE